MSSLKTLVLNRTEIWVEENHVLAEEQTGFRQSRSTVDNCLILSHLIAKYAYKTPFCCFYRPHSSILQLMSPGGAVVRMQYCKLFLLTFGSSILTGSRLSQPSTLLRLVK
uniref:Reverse transcriptase domain-containing protein n=1 Tax=Micrurus corallinus TaxID=54390 RepID=A0A2D4G6F3_MICCO